MLSELKKNNNIIVDSSVLLDYFELILNYKENKDQLIRYNSLFKDKKIFIVPQVLSELYSLLKRDVKKQNTKLKAALKYLLKYLKLLKEEYIPKEEILNEDKFIDFGFTDIALFKLLNKENRILISNDFGLVEYCKSKGLNAILLEKIFYL